jgi:hypothetical protein
MCFTLRELFLGCCINFDNYFFFGDRHGNLLYVSALNVYKIDRNA